MLLTSPYRKVVALNWFLSQIYNFIIALECQMCLMVPSAQDKLKYNTMIFSALI